MRTEDVYVFLTQWQCSARPRAFLLNRPEALPLGQIQPDHYHLIQLQLFSLQAH